MNTEPTRLQRLVIGAIGLVLHVALGLWLTLSYFGVLDERRQGLRRGRDASATRSGPEPRSATTASSSAGSCDFPITATAIACICWSTRTTRSQSRRTPPPGSCRARCSGRSMSSCWPSKDAASDNHLASGDVLAADSTEATLSLMKSFDEAERLISAVDAEDINRITGKLAPALDGKGDDIKDFFERADRVVTDFNRDLPTMWETLKLAPRGLGTIADIEPDLISAMGHCAYHHRHDRRARTRPSARSSRISQGRRSRRHSARQPPRTYLLPFVQQLERLTGLAADNGPAVQQILASFAMTGTNGACRCRRQRDPDDRHDRTRPTARLHAADCTRYGPTLIARNCGGPIPAERHLTRWGRGHRRARREITAMLEQAESASQDDKPVAGSVATLPETPSETQEPQGFFEILRELGLLMGSTTP